MRYSVLKEIEGLIKDLIKDLREGLSDAEAPEICKRLGELGIMAVCDDSLRGAIMGCGRYLQIDREVRKLTAIYAERFPVHEPAREHLVSVLELALNYVESKLEETENA